MAETRKQLEALAESGRYCTVERSVDDDTERHYGYVVAIGDDHFAMETFHQFHRDGVCVFRLEDAREVSTSDSNDFFGKIITKEGLRHELPPKDVLRGYTSLLDWAAGGSELVVMEAESNQPDEGDFWLGRVVSVSGGMMDLVYVDATGCWDDEPSRIPVADLTRVEVRSKYCELFAKYAEPFDEDGRTA